jgi:arylsulfatase
MRGLIEYRPTATYVDDGNAVEQLPTDFHSSEYFASRLIEFIEQDSESKAPFFAYFAPTAAHWPYQLPDRYLDLYKGAYDAGYDALRQQRFATVRKKGLVSNYPDAFPRLDGVAAWESLSPEEQRTEARKMELYAASIEHLDLQVGRLLDALNELDQLQNTVIFVVSDNGPEGNDRSRIATNDEWLPRAWDLSYENMGRRDSYVYYGAGWAQASAAPFWLFKSYAGEGGTRVPLIISLPGAERGGAVEESFATVLDFVPTVRQLAGLDEQPGSGSPATSGSSLLPVLRGSAEAVHSDDYRHGWELFGHRALRQGNWKIRRLAGDQGTGEWRLYDIANDPGESNDLAATNPEKVLELEKYWDEYVRQNNVIIPDSSQERAFGF